MSAQFKMTLTNSLDEIPVLAERIEAFCAHHQVARRDLHAINLALEELVTNVIHYAWQDEHPHELQVRVVVEDGVLEAVVEDDGRPFDPLQKETPNLNRTLDEIQPGGLGIHLVKQMMDQVSYAYAEGRNRLTVRKRIG